MYSYQEYVLIVEQLKRGRVAPLINEYSALVDRNIKEDKEFYHDTLTSPGRAFALVETIVMLGRGPRFTRRLFEDDELIAFLRVEHYGYAFLPRCDRNSKKLMKEVKRSDYYKRLQARAELEELELVVVTINVATASNSISDYTVG